MLLDNLLPAWEFREYHSITIEAPPHRVFAAIKQVTPDEVPLFRILFTIRALPALILHKAYPPFRGKQSTFEQALQSGFTLLAEQPAQELVFGIIGQFWRIKSNVLTIANAEEFMAFEAPGFAKAAMNFVVRETGNGSWSRLATETRIHIPDLRTRKSFFAYWFVIRWGSSLIRRMWLRSIKRRAERHKEDGEHEPSGTCGSVPS